MKRKSVGDIFGSMPEITREVRVGKILILPVNEGIFAVS